MDRCDALIVLEREAIPPSALAGAPKIYRAYADIESVMARSGPQRVTATRVAGLPAVRVYEKRDLAVRDLDTLRRQVCGAHVAARKRGARDTRRFRLN